MFAFSQDTFQLHAEEGDSYARLHLASAKIRYQKTVDMTDLASLPFPL
jgi:hypothetical protein